MNTVVSFTSTFLFFLSCLCHEYDNSPFPSVSQLQAAQAAVADVLQAAVGTPCLGVALGGR